MEFPRNNRKLKEIFTNSRTPELSELNGEYSVDMLTLIPSLKRLEHRKVFYPEDAGVTGHNILLNIKWGRFFLERGTCKDLGHLGVVVINYDRPRNLCITKKVRDHLRCVENGELYLGRFNVLLLDKLYFLGYFSLRKVNVNILR
ncbi:MAG: hypothetical protein JSV71_03665 [Nitrospiraceae bacterium]|nr:MAG: hypothetical protein JSV71_03665 [Nitrospiraceae bacterium]